MPLTIPGELMMKPFSGMKSAVSGRIIISRAFQKTLGELAMSRFISYSGSRLAGTDIADAMWDALIKAYIYFVGLPFILNWAGDAIMVSDILRAYFQQWETARTYFYQRTYKRGEQVKPGDWSAYRDMILSKTGYSKPLYDKFNPRADLRSVERYKSARLLEMQDAGELNEGQLCKLPTQCLQDTASPASFFIMQAQSVPLASVFIGMDVTIIFSNIQLMLVYRKAMDAKASSTDVPAWLKSQSARVTDSGGHLAKVSFDANGKFTVSIPQTSEIPRHVVFNTYALKTTLDLTKLACTMILHEPWDLETREPPEMASSFTEYWTFEAREAPGMTQLMLEPWNREANEPEMTFMLREPWDLEGIPEMTALFIEPWTGVAIPPLAMSLVFTEYWGTPALTMTLKFFEKWGTPAPAMTQKFIEPWTS